jgi:hypothetical protein
MTESFWTRSARKILQATFYIGLLTILDSFAPAQPMCDVNGDGIVDVLDVQLIANWAAGVQTNLSVRPRAISLEVVGSTHWKLRHRRTWAHLGWTHADAL